MNKILAYLPLPCVMMFVLSSVRGAQGQIPDPLILDSHDREYIKLKLHKAQLYRYSEDLNRFFLDFRAWANKEENPKWTDVTVGVTVYFSDGTKVAFDAMANFDADDQSTEISGSPDEIVGSTHSRSFQPSEIKSWQVQLRAGHYLSLESVPSFAGLIAADLGCYRDLVNAESLEGAARREAILKLITLGCASFLEEPMEVVKQESSMATTAVHVRLLISNWPKEDIISEGYVRRVDVQSRTLEVKRALRP